MPASRRSIWVAPRPGDEGVTYTLRTVPGIDAVLVSYSDAVTNRACTSAGNNVTVTFVDAPWPSRDGDLPELVGHARNAVRDEVTGLLKGDGTFLHGIYGGFFDDHLQLGQHAGDAHEHLRQALRYRRVVHLQ